MLYIYYVTLSSEHYEVVVIIPISQMRKWQLRKVKQRARPAFLSFSSPWDWAPSDQMTVLWGKQGSPSLFYALSCQAPRWAPRLNYPACWVTQSCPTLCDSMDYSPPDSSVHGVLQARIVEWVAISISRGSSWPRDQTCVSYVSCIGRWALYH